MEAEIEKMSLESKDLVAERIDQVKALFPEIVTEGEGSIDFEKLRLILGDEVDEGQERYAFTWPGKADAIRQAQIPSTATLRPDKESSVDWDTTENLYIEGDNLEVLKLLQRGYHGKVKMIYIDPPYNTGHDFVYKDSFQDSIENYKEQAGLSRQSNADTNGRYHSDWLSMMYPRLRLARELLSEDGLIFISIDENELDNLLKLCDELFLAQRRIGIFKWNKTSKAPTLSKCIRNKFEYVLCYAKNERGVLRGPKSYNSAAPLYNLSNRRQTLEFPPGVIDCSFPDGVYKAGGYGAGDKAVVLERDLVVFGGVNSEPVRLTARFKWTQDTLNQRISEGQRFQFKKPSFTTMYYYLGGDKHIAPSDVISKDECGVLRNDEAYTELIKMFGFAPFDYTKPVSLIQHFMHMVEEGGIVLDFFSGSATTAHAAMLQNASDDQLWQYIMVQLPETIDEESDAWADGYRNLCQIGEERIRRAGKKIKAEIEEENKQIKLGEEPKPIPDIGFRALRLDSSSFDKVEGGALVESIVKADRTHEDIIFEMMIKWGLDLSLPMEETEVLGYPITSIAADELICCMDEGLTIEVLEAIAGLEPKRVFFLDSVLTDTVKLNAAQIFKRASERAGIEIELRTV